MKASLYHETAFLGSLLKFKHHSENKYFCVDHYATGRRQSGVATKSRKAEGHMFSIMLKSKNHVKSLSLPHDKGGNVLIEGFLGKLENLNFTEGLMLEINGANGSLRMDFSEKELKRLLPKGTIIHKKLGKGVNEE